MMSKGSKNSIVVEKEYFCEETEIYSKIKDVLLVLSFSFLTVISSKIKVELGTVPMTMQTLIVLLSGALLGSKRGALSQVFYVLGGLAGLPWFSRGGGLIYLLSPTFGYILGFVPSSYAVGFLIEKSKDKNILNTFFSSLIGTFIIYVFGLIWLARFLGFPKALIIGVYPFLSSEFLKLILLNLILFAKKK